MPSNPVLLIVEDEFLIRASTVAVAQAAGFHVLEAVNADDAVCILESRADVRVLFTDIDMPGSINGLRLAGVVRDRWPPIELVVTSGKTPPQPHELPARCRFVPKPYAYPDLKGLFQSLAQRTTATVQRGAKYWRQRAEEARARAEEMRDAAAVATMSEIARLYDRMAERAAKGGNAI
jgi:DNA-binding NtrC family response regulator